MKQLLAILAILLLMMLVITTVMAVGNVHQSEQLTQRTRQVSTLRAELQTLRQEHRQLDQKMQKAQAAMQRSRTENSVLENRFGLLTALLRTDPAIARHAAFAGAATQRPATGEALLAAGALEGMLRRLDEERTKPDGASAVLLQTSPAPALYAGLKTLQPEALQAALQAAAESGSAPAGSEKAQLHEASAVIDDAMAALAAGDEDGAEEAEVFAGAAEVDAVVEETGVFAAALADGARDAAQAMLTADMGSRAAPAIHPSLSRLLQDNAPDSLKWALHLRQQAEQAMHRLGQLLLDALCE